MRLAIRKMSAARVVVCWSVSVGVGSGGNGGKIGCGAGWTGGGKL